MIVKCSVCGGALSRSDAEDGMTFHAADPGGPPTCSAPSRTPDLPAGTQLVKCSAKLPASDVAYLESLGPTFSAGVREAVRRLRAAEVTGEQRA